MAHRSVNGKESLRRIEVDPERVASWVNGFARRHGKTDCLPGRLVWSPSHRSVSLSAEDGATAVLQPFAISGSGVLGDWSGLGELEALTRWVAPPDRLGLILVRRGGYAVGLAKGRELTGHKVGTRYVQSRTAAGGWSQHRFARRRDNQTDALVVSVIEHTRRVVMAAPVDALVVGGDKTLVRNVLDDPRLARLTRVPRRELFDLPDPKLVILRQALRRGRAVRIVLCEPDVRLSLR
jgi:hypothetical protein